MGRKLCTYGTTEQYFTICKLPLFRFEDGFSFTFIDRIESEVGQQVFFVCLLLFFYLSKLYGAQMTERHDTNIIKTYLNTRFFNRHTCTYLCCINKKHLYFFIAGEWNKYFLEILNQNNILLYFYR